jgi:hypothetical protein
VEYVELIKFVSVQIVVVVNRVTVVQIVISHNVFRNVQTVAFVHLQTLVLVQVVGSILIVRLRFVIRLAGMEVTVLHLINVLAHRNGVVRIVEFQYANKNA